MTIDLSNGTALSDPELLQEVRRLASQERHAIARLIAALGELDARRLYLGEGCSSLFTYCTQVLHLSEHAAYGRIEAARAARKWPAIFELLADGSVHLTAIGLLAPHLTAENHQQVLAAARHRSKREVEEIVASLRPQAPVPASVRRLPTPKALLADRAPAPPDPTRAAPTTTERAAVQPALEKPKPRAEVKPLAPEQYKVQFTVSRETYQNLREAQDLLRHRIPNGDVTRRREGPLRWARRGRKDARGHGRQDRSHSPRSSSDGRQRAPIATSTLSRGQAIPGAPLPCPVGSDLQA